MMYNYPFFSFPHFGRYAHYYPNHYSIIKQSTKQNACNSIPIKDVNSKTCITAAKPEEKSSSKRTPVGFSFLNHFLHQEDRDSEEECFHIFGLKLYHDDILLIGLIFFLYQEEVKDPYLFIALILLLLS